MPEVTEFRVLVSEGRRPPTYKLREVALAPGGSKVREIGAALIAAAGVYKAGINEMLRMNCRRGKAKDARQAAIYAAFTYLRVSPEDICDYFHFQTESPIRDLHWNISRRLCVDEDLIAELDEVRRRCERTAAEEGA